jgi:uncharacterized membrane protein
MSHLSAATYSALVDIPPVRRIGTSDVWEALAAGYRDFMAMPSHLVFVGLIYPILGIFLASAAFDYDLMPLLFPLVSGFALIGPFAAIGLYELSRQRERGLNPGWQDAFAVLRSPAIGAIVGMGLLLVAIFLLWLLAANAIFTHTMGSTGDMSYTTLLSTILTTERGWALILVGNAVGFIFAALVLTISVVAFPLILDRHAGIGVAIATSVRAVAANPVPMALWGLTVAIVLALGSLPIFVGLAVAMPILGHATWHLYRRVVEP